MHVHDCNLEVSILLVSLYFKTLSKMFTQRGVEYAMPVTWASVSSAILSNFEQRKVADSQ